MRPDLDPLLKRLRDLPDGEAPYDYAEFAHRRSRRQQPIELRLRARIAGARAGQHSFRHPDFSQSGHLWIRCANSAKGCTRPRRCDPMAESLGCRPSSPSRPEWRNW